MPLFLILYNMEQIARIKQGDNLGITMTLDTSLQGKDFYLGFYSQNYPDRKASIMLSTKDNSLFQIGENIYQANISHDITKTLNVGSYRIEALIKSEADEFVSISENYAFIKIEPSSIGKEIA